MKTKILCLGLAAGIGLLVSSCEDSYKTTAYFPSWEETQQEAYDNALAGTSLSSNLDQPGYELSGPHDVFPSWEQNEQDAKERCLSGSSYRLDSPEIIEITEEEIYN